jgi:hypothetical protein
MKRYLFLIPILAAPAAVPAVAQTIQRISTERPVHAPVRYGIAADLQAYPQDHPQRTIRSVVKAALSGRIDYMLAQLLSPTQVDAKLKGDVDALRRLKAQSTPEARKRIAEALSLQIEEGTWLVTKKLAWAQIEGLPLLSLEKIGDRWYMHNVAVPVPEEGE